MFLSEITFDPFDLFKIMNLHVGDKKNIPQSKKPSYFWNYRLTYKRRVFEMGKAMRISGKIYSTKKALQLFNCRAGCSVDFNFAFQKVNNLYFPAEGPTAM